MVPYLHGCVKLLFILAGCWAQSLLHWSLTEQSQSRVFRWATTNLSTTCKLIFCTFVLIFAWEITSIWLQIRPPVFWLHDYLVRRISFVCSRDVVIGWCGVRKDVYNYIMYMSSKSFFLEYDRSLCSNLLSSKVGIIWYLTLAGSWTPRLEL